MGASLGYFTNAYNVSKHSIQLLYTNGDHTEDTNTGRQIYVNLSCGSGDLTITDYVQAQYPPPPNNAPYTYYVYATHKALCKYFAPPPPPAGFSCKFGKYDLSSMAGESDVYLWYPVDQNTVTVSICGTLNTTCGTFPQNKCSSISSGCTSACQTWVDNDGESEGVSLGYVTDSYNVSKYGIQILYTQGDVTDQGYGRQIYVNLGCGVGGLSATNFIQPSSNPPPSGIYSYYIYLTHKHLCKYFPKQPPPHPPPRAQCKFDQFDLCSIAGSMVDFTWDPSDQNTISLAIVGTLPKTCGSDPSDLCDNIAPNCTSACQSWIDESSSYNAVSLGKFTDWFQVGKYSLTFLYLGGDVTLSGIGRQLYVELGCGSGALAIINFTQPTEPPPPGDPYTYYIMATHNYLCKYFKPKPPNSPPAIVALDQY
jgi:hypothetical protein